MCLVVHRGVWPRQPPPPPRLWPWPHNPRTFPQAHARCPHTPLHFPSLLARPSPVVQAIMVSHYPLRMDTFDRTAEEVAASVTGPTTQASA